MTLVIDLAPEVEASLQQEASRHGLAAPDYVRQLIEHAVKVHLLAEMRGESEAAEKALPEAKHSIMELHGLGKEVWQGVDAQQYVNALRSEWDERL